MSLYRLFLIGTSVLVLSACGFQLRSAPAMPTELARTYVSSDDRQTLFVRKLTEELRANGVSVVDTPVDATAVLPTQSMKT